MDNSQTGRAPQAKKPFISTWDPSPKKGGCIVYNGKPLNSQGSSIIHFPGFKKRQKQASSLGQYPRIFKWRSRSSSDRTFTPGCISVGLPRCFFFYPAFFFGISISHQFFNLGIPPPRKFNSSPLKNDAWKTILSYWEYVVPFQGKRTVQLREDLVKGIIGRSLIPIGIPSCYTRLYKDYMNKSLLLGSCYRDYK